MKSASLPFANNITQRVAFVIHNIIHFRSSLSVARAIDGAFKVDFYFLDDQLLELCRKDVPETYVQEAMFKGLMQKFNFYTLPSCQGDQKKRKKSRSAYLHEYIRGIVPDSAKRLYIRAKRYMVPVGIWRHWLRALMFCRLLKRYHPDVLILGQADIETMSELYIGCAKRFGIKTIINPFTFCTTDSILKYFETSLERNLANRFDCTILKPLYPQWFHPHRNYMLMRATPAIFMATSMLGYRYEMPWKQDYSSADILLVDNAVALKHYQSMNFPETQLRCIGLPEYDVLAERLANKQALYEELCKEYELDSRLRLAVIALPPVYELGLTRSDFSSFEELVAFVAAPFSETQKWNVMLCPHPRSSVGNYIPSSEYVRIAHQPTFDLLPLGDVYVSFVSVTIKWANFCGIPALNYDVYAMKDFDHLETDNIISVDTNTAYRHAAMALCTDPTYYAQWKAKQQESRQLWGNTKGTAQQELIALLHELAQA